MRGFELVRWGGILLAVAILLALVTPELPQLRPWQWAAMVLVGMGLWWSSQRVSQRLPKVSLAALLLLVGLLASFVSLTQNARVWRVALTIPGRSDLAALSPAADRIATIDHTAVGASGCLALWDVRDAAIGPSALAASPLAPARRFGTKGDDTSRRHLTASGCHCWNEGAACRSRNLPIKKSPITK
jgi:hypothetical protein